MTRIVWRPNPNFAGLSYGRFHRNHWSDGWSLDVARNVDERDMRIWKASHGPFKSVRAVNAVVRTIEAGKRCACRHCETGKSILTKRRERWKR